MEPFLLLIASWWWVAPAAAGIGAAAYGGLTMKGRRARRLELDAARFEEAAASRALTEARAVVSTAQAHVLAMRAESGSPLLDALVPTTAASAEARRMLGAAKQRERSAWLAVRAARTRIKAAEVRYHAASRTDPLPLERELAAHDAVIARWMAYETDAGRALTYPQLLDSRNPATHAFLVAQSTAQRLRPASAQESIPPQRYLEYRAAVRDTQAAFDEAERQAHAAAARTPFGQAPATPRFSKPSPPATASREREASAPPPSTATTSPSAPPPASPAAPAPSSSRPAVWPVPSWRPSQR